MCEERERDRKREAKRDWSALPSELIHLISKRIFELCGFIRFRAVCKRWHTSVPLSEAPPQLPWLLEADDDDIGPTTNLHEKHRFYSLFTGEIGTIHIKPSYQGKYFTGPSLGHLLTRDIGFTGGQKSCHLFNPLTDEEISLPPQSAPLGSQIIDTLIEFTSWGFYDGHDGDYITIERRSLYSCCHYRGLIYQTRGGESTDIHFDDSGSISYMIPPPLDEIQIGQPCTSFLVGSAGVVLRVSLYSEYSEHYSYFRIYKPMFDGRTRFWVEISNIGDQVLFLDLIEGFSISATAFPGGLIRGNSIYFMCTHDFQPCRYDIQHGFVERLPCPFQNCTWFVPTLRTIAA